MKKTIKNIIFSKSLFFLITTGVILTLNLTPLISHIKHSPSGRSFALIHNNTQDFFFYQSLMNQGANGSWLTTDPYTTEPHQSSIIFAYFVWLGKVSKILGVSYAVTYHLVRIVLSILFLFSIYYFLFTISSPYPRLTYLFFLFASPFMHKIPGGRTVPFMHWWTGMDPIRRVAYLPHHMFGGLLLVLSILLITRLHLNEGVTLTKAKKYLAFLVFLSLLLAFIHTPSLLILLITLPASVVIYFFSNLISLKDYKSEIRNPKSETSTNDQNPNDQNSFGNLRIRILNLFRASWLEFRAYFLYWLIGLFFLLFMVSQTNRGFPWSQYIQWERKLQFPLDKELIGALGILLPFSILGVVKSLSSKRFDQILIACWLIAPLFLIPFAPKLGLSNIRLIQGVPYLPLAILATMGIKTIENFFLRSAKIIVIIIFLIFTYPVLSWSLKDQIREFWPIFGNVYFDNRLNSAFAFIEQNFPAKTITLSTFYTGNYLPAFTNTVSFIGHSGYTYNVEKKQLQVRKFFENKMKSQEAKEFIANNKIALIFQGPEEKPIYSDYLYPKLLKTVYDREEVTLYILSN